MEGARKELREIIAHVRDSSNPSITSWRAEFREWEKRAWNLRVDFSQPPLSNRENGEPLLPRRGWLEKGVRG